MCLGTMAGWSISRDRYQVRELTCVILGRFTLRTSHKTRLRKKTARFRKGPSGEGIYTSEQNTCTGRCSKIYSTYQAV